MTRYSQILLAAAQLLLAGSLCAQPSVPEIPYDSAPNLLKMPEHIHMGEAVGVATTSKGNILVYTRTGSTNATLGGSRAFTHGGARLFEFRPKWNVCSRDWSGLIRVPVRACGAGRSTGQYLGYR